MLNRNRDSREGQMNKKIHGMAAFQNKNEPYLKSEPMQTENILKDDAVRHNSIQLFAYQIYQNKGGSALDNWLEAERTLKYKHYK